MAKQLKALSIIVEENNKGGPEKLKVVEVDIKDPSDNEVGIEVKACGVNFIDTYHRSGLYPGVTRIGREGAGIITKIGKNVKGYKIGDKVCWWGIEGSYSTHVVANPDALMRIPEDLHRNSDMETFKIAAAIPLQCLTAHYLSTSTYKVTKSDKVLIHAGAGGTGGLLIQMCKILGANMVITTVSNEEKKKIALKNGADHVIIYTKQDFKEEVMKLTNNKGVNVVYDGVGKSTWEKSLECVCKRGYVVFFGNASGPVPPIDPLKLTKLGSIYITRPTLFDYVGEELNFRSTQIFDWIRSNQLIIYIGNEFSLKDAVKSHEYLESRDTAGKIILLP